MSGHQPLPIQEPLPRSATKVTIINRGLKHTQGMLPKAYLYLDCRGLPDGAAGEGPAGGGDSQAAQDYMWQHASTTIMSMVELSDTALQRVPRRRRNEANPYERPLVICCFCAFGLNRSRAAKHLVAKKLRELGYVVEVPWGAQSKSDVPFVSMGE